MKVRSYEKGDEQAIMALDARVLPSVWNRRTLQNWYWKYTATNPAGASLIQVADHKEQLIAHFAAVPYRLKVFDEELTASHSIGALVEEKYQNRGLLKLVGDKLMEDLAAHNIPYTWGFPNRRAHQFETVILGYRDLINFAEWQLPNEKLVRREPPLSFRKITVFNDDFDKLWETCSPGYEIAVKRDKTYLKWRYLGRPDWWYFPYGVYEGNELKGYVVLKLYREEKTLKGHIIDIFARRDDEATLSQLIDGSLNFFAEQAVDMVTVWFRGNPLIEKLFNEKNFSKVDAEIPLILRINTDHVHKDKVADNTHWYFTMGDSTEVF
ncbi:MAG: GNAT family N-acetyltransferase [bacterium]|nr:GNAT family N-acetyltransferase [bacterium]